MDAAESIEQENSKIQLAIGCQNFMGKTLSHLAWNRLDSVL